MRTLTRHSCRPHLAGRLGLLAALVVATLLGGCAPRWTITVEVDGTPAAPLTAKAWKEVWEDWSAEAADGQGLPLERLLWEAGVDSAETLEVDGRSWRWEDVCAEAWVGRDGRVTVGDGAAVAPGLLSIRRPPEAGQATSTHLDLAPTVASVLGLPAPQQATGSALTDLRADRAVLIVLDGLGYRWYEASRGQGVTPFLDGLDAPTLARSVYPSVTRVSMAAILSGALPAVNGVRDRGTRNLAVQSILQAVTEAGRRAVVVEGEALPINMPGAELRLSGDRDGDGYTDDNTFDNAMAVLTEGLPEFLLVHFHGIDDAGHTYGPDSAEYRERMTAVDGYLERLLAGFPAGTVVLITADHGMHTVHEGDKLGNHGTLSGEDMFVPLWVVRY